MKSVCIESAGELHPSELCGSSILQLRQMCLSLCKTVLSSKKKTPPPHSPPSIYPSISTHSRGCTLGLFAEKAEEWRVEADSHLAGLSLPHVSGFNKKRVSAAVRRWRGRGGGGRALGTRRRGRTSK